MKLPKDQPFWTSIVLHLVVLIGLFLATIIETLKPKERLHVFEIVETVAAQPQPPSSEVSPPLPDIPLPDLPPVPDLADIPKPVVPQLQPQPPQPTPPAPPSPTPPKPKVMSYEDFIRQNPIRDPQPRQPVRPQPRINPNDVRIDVPRPVVHSNPTPSANNPPPLSRQQLDALGAYSAKLRSRIVAAWTKPDGLASVGAAATVVFDVSASGRITNARLNPSSGNAAFDQSVLSAFRRVVSAGPTPTGQGHSFTMTFRMSDL